MLCVGDLVPSKRIQADEWLDKVITKELVHVTYLGLARPLGSGTEDSSSHTRGWLSLHRSKEIRTFNLIDNRTSFSGMQSYETQQ